MCNFTFMTFCFSSFQKPNLVAKCLRFKLWKINIIKRVNKSFQTKLLETEIKVKTREAKKKLGSKITHFENELKQKTSYPDFNHLRCCTENCQSLWKEFFSTGLGINIGKLLLSKCKSFASQRFSTFWVKFWSFFFFLLWKVIERCCFGFKMCPF